MYSIVTVPDDAPENPEQLGTKRKFWYSDENGGSVLFKEGRPGTGENWAEKVCAEICELLQIPHAKYEFACWAGRQGVVSPSFLPVGGRLILGNELLVKVIEDYPHVQRYRARQHSVRLVQAILRAPIVIPPLEYVSDDGIETAADVFVGYLMLDALVGNQDRHHENWGLILDSAMGLTLTPTFDHASSLGRNELDERRLERLHTSDGGRSVEHYARRAKSAFYTLGVPARQLSTLAAFGEAAKNSRAAADYWIQKLRSTTIEDFREIFAMIPAELITAPAVEFALSMIEINRMRLLEEVEW